MTQFCPALSENSPSVNAVLSDLSGLNRKERFLLIYLLQIPVPREWADHRLQLDCGFLDKVLL